MIKIWARLIKKNKILQGHMITYEDEEPSVDLYMDALHDICYTLDIENPVVLNKHKMDMVNFGITQFLPSDFMDKVEFDRMEIEIFIEKEEK